MSGFREHRCLGPNDRKTDLDRLVGVICLAFEIVNDAGLEALRKQGYMDSLICHPFGAKAVFTKHDTHRKWEEDIRLYEEVFGWTLVEHRPSCHMGAAPKEQ